jgi:hypothetical protein
MPVMVKDEEGNERELRVGDLVEHRGAFGSQRPMRVTSFERGAFDDGDALLECSFTGDAWWATVNRMTLIQADPKDEEKEPSLQERRERLKNNLCKCHRACVGQDRPLIERFYSALSTGDDEHYWFWASVAESFDDPRQVSYAPTKDAYDVNAKRRRCRVSKFLKGVAKQRGLSFTDAEAARVGELVGSHFPDSYDYEFVVVRGPNAIREAYYDAQGAAWSSCMHRRPYVAWYDETPEKIGLVKIMQGSNYVGRALLWTTDQGPLVVDRVYPSDNGPHTNALHRWAEANGYDYKTQQSSCEGYLRSGRRDYTVTVKASSSGIIPTATRLSIPMTTLKIARR